MKNYFVNLQTRLKYKILESNTDTVTLVPAFSPRKTEIKLDWKEFYAQYKPLQEPAKENEGWD